MQTFSEFICSKRPFKFTFKIVFSLSSSVECFKILQIKEKVFYRPDWIWIVEILIKIPFDKQTLTQNDTDS